MKKLWSLIIGIINKTVYTVKCELMIVKWIITRILWRACTYIGCKRWAFRHNFPMRSHISVILCKKLEQSGGHLTRNLESIQRHRLQNSSMRHAFSLPQVNLDGKSKSPASCWNSFEMFEKSTSCDLIPNLWCSSFMNWLWQIACDVQSM